MKKKWMDRATTGPPRLAFYAYQQAETWRRFTDLANTALTKFGNL